MKKYENYAAVALAVSVLVAALSGCHKDEGPAERAGKAMDKAVEDAGRQVEKAGDQLQDAARNSRR